MARRLRRLQKLDDQNDLFTPATSVDDNHGSTKSRSTTRRDRNKHRVPPPHQPKDVNISAGRIEDEEQLNSISANAPAVLLQSGPGTGKSSVLAARIAYLLQSGQSEPENMVILSFTNRDAAAIKERALELLYPTNNAGNATDSERKKDADKQNAAGTLSSSVQTKKELGNKLWSGTVHAFASGILNKYARQKGGSPRIVASTEIHKMVKTSITSIIGSGDNADGKRRTSLTISNENSMKTNRHRFNAAMGDSNQNMRVVVADVVRCIDLWKESGMLSPAVQYSGRAGRNNSARRQSGDENGKNNRIRQNCVEMAVRWGVPQSAAILALDVYPEYQKLHAEAGTADPSDLASLARDFLVANPGSLSALRIKLKHVILDEYQDVSVSQHALLRLVLHGREEESKKKRIPRKGGRTKKQPICYDVPRLFCAGDANQSLYGWRGAKPSLTVDNFLEDYPQGVLIPLGTNYRLPRSIMEAASKLISANNPNGEEDEVGSMTTFAVSPAASTAMSSKLLSQPGLSLAVNPEEEELALKKMLSESSSTISIQELWDAREEAKFVAASIRKRSKERIQRCSKALAQLVDARVGSPSSAGEEWSLFDPTDVAIVVRSSSGLKVIQEMLSSHGIPYEENDARSISSPSRRGNRIAPLKPGDNGTSMHIKPVKLITMHRCKGDEFDDVYLCGWVEGVFPHPSAISTGSFDEERRLAYVALTRARQRAVITYPTMERIAHIGPGGRRKHVTSQAKPSRFLHELMPATKVHHCDSSKRGDNISWNDDYGIKYSVAGKNLPDHFVKSYQVPEGYRPERGTATPPSSDGDGASATDANAALVADAKPITSTEASISDLALLDTKAESDTGAQEGGEHLLSLIGHALVEMSDLRVKGACELYKKTFKEMLRDFGISRGSALVFVDKKKSDSTSIEELINASDDEVTSKALSKCTAKELGHFLAYLILSVDSVE